MSSGVGALFVAQSRDLLRAYRERIRASVAELDDAALWRRSNEASNSVGNLLLHLAGNVRQWIVSGVGGAPDTRARQAEFDAREGATSPELLARLDAVLDEADAVLAALDERRLLERCVVQGRDIAVLEAIYHVVEHFSGHTAQIIYAVKAYTARDLGFYRPAPGAAAGSGGEP